MARSATARSLATGNDAPPTPTTVDKNLKTPDNLTRLENRMG